MEKSFEEYIGDMINFYQRDELHINENDTESDKRFKDIKFGKLNAYEDILKKLEEQLYDKVLKENVDIIYVVYLDNKMYNENNRKTAYKLISGAKAVITSDCRKVAHDIFDKAKTGKCWYDIGEEAKQEYLAIARERFEIREFVERSK